MESIGVWEDCEMCEWVEVCPTS